MIEVIRTIVNAHPGWSLFVLAIFLWCIGRGVENVLTGIGRRIGTRP